jgi:hypothetical protein
MIDEGTKLTDVILSDLNTRLYNIYKDVYKQIIKDNNKVLKKLEELSYDKTLMIEYLRTSRLKDIISHDIANVGKDVSKMINDEMLNVFTLNLDYGNFIIDKQANISLDWTLYDKNQLKVILMDKQPVFSKLAYKNLSKESTILQSLSNQLGIATIKGENQAKLIARIREVTKQSENQARRVAQTERTRLQSQGRDMGINDANNIGVETQKQWYTRFVNSRESHKKTHLDIVNSDDVFKNGLEYPGDPSGEAWNVINCHCFIKPIVVDVPDSIKKYRDSVKHKTFETFHKSRKQFREQGSDKIES